MCFPTDSRKRLVPALRSVATYKEGEDQAGYWPDAKPETHKVSLEPFRRESLKILKVFADSCPTIGRWNAQSEMKQGALL